MQEYTCIKNALHKSVNAEMVKMECYEYMENYARHFWNKTVQHHY